MTSKKLAALAAALALALPAASLAASSDTNVIVDGHAGTETRSIRVSLGDLNLASSRGARMADSRVMRAAQKVCGFMNGSVQHPTREYRTCFGEALTDAREDLGALIQAQAQG